MKKRTLKQHSKTYTLIMAAAVILALVSCALTEAGKPHFTLWIAIALVVVGLIYASVFLKCPHCGRALSGNRKIPDNCPHCGEPLDALSGEDAAQ